MKDVSEKTMKNKIPKRDAPGKTMKKMGPKNDAPGKVMKDKMPKNDAGMSKKRKHDCPGCNCKM